MAVSIGPDDRRAGTKALLLGNWEEHDRVALERADVRALEVNSAKGSRVDTLDFLARVPPLEHLDVVDLKLADVTGVEAQPDLLSLHLSAYADTPVDFRRFRRLRSCYIEWRHGYDSIFECRTLEELYVNRFPHADLRRVGALTDLRALRVGNGSALLTCAGVESLDRLEVLGSTCCTS